MSHINLRGHQVWSVEYANNGEAAVLLHGGLSANEDWDQFILPAVADTHHVFGYDRTGHGRTGIRDGYYHFDFQADEAIAYIEDVVKEPAHLIGLSDGGIIALLVAIKRPDLVKSIVGIGTNFHWDAGFRDSFDATSIEISEEDRAEFLERSPDPIEVQEQTIRLAFETWLVEPTMTTDDLAKISCPTLVVAGDDEPFSNHHTVELYESLQDGRLAIIPGASHYAIKERNELVIPIIRDFYQHLEFPITKWPVRRKKD